MPSSSTTRHSRSGHVSACTEANAAWTYCGRERVVMTAVTSGAKDGESLPQFFQLSCSTFHAPPSLSIAIVPCIVSLPSWEVARSVA